MSNYMLNWLRYVTFHVYFNNKHHNSSVIAKCNQFIQFARCSVHVSVEFFFLNCTIATGDFHLEAL